MLKVYRSDTDQYVLVHEPTQTVALGDSFDEAHTQLKAQLGDDFAQATAAPATEPTRGNRGLDGRTVHYGLLVLLVLLPFVWLGVLHASLGALVVELRGSIRETANRGPANDETSDLQADLDAIGRQVGALNDDVRALRKAAKSASKREPPPEPAEDTAASPP